MKEQKYNKLAIIGLITSFIFSIVGLIISYIAIKQISQTNEKGENIAKAGIVISIIKLLLIFIAIILLIIGINNLNKSDVDGPIKSSSNSYKCSKAKNCTYNSSEGIYSCIYFNKDDGVEEYITCDSIKNDKINITTTEKDTSKDDEDYDDTFDYDRDDIVPNEN